MARQHTAPGQRPNRASLSLPGASAGQHQRSTKKDDQVGSFVFLESCDALNVQRTNPPDHLSKAARGRVVLPLLTIKEEIAVFRNGVWKTAINLADFPSYPLRIGH